MDQSLLGLLERSRRIGSWWLDVERSVVTWSPAVYAIHEEDPSRAITLERAVEYYVPEHRPMIERGIQDAIEKRESWDVELQIRTARGNTRWVRAIGEPVFEGDELVRLQGIFEDIDARKSLEVEREGLVMRLDLALDSSAIGVWEWDVRSNELIWDDRMLALYGLERGTFDSEYEVWERALHPEDRQPAIDAVQAALAGREGFATVFRIRRPTGEVATLQGIADLIRGSDGEPQRMIGVNWDISETVRVHEELERSNEELLQFAYRTSHDLKAPLVAIRRLAGLVADDLQAGQTQDVLADVGRIETAATNAESMVRGLLEAAKADLQDLTVEGIDFEPLVARVLRGQEMAADGAGVRLESHVSVVGRPDFPRVRLEQLLANLVANGIQHSEPTRDDRFVRVEAERRNGSVHLRVSDNGPGLGDADPNEPFRMFHRLRSDSSGSGLGLYIVRKHVDAMSGEIRFDTSPEGTTFEVTLPVQDRSR